MDRGFPDLPNTKMSAYEKRIVYGAQTHKVSRDVDQVSDIFNPVVDAIDADYTKKNRKLIKQAEQHSKMKQMEREREQVEMEDTKIFRLKRFQDVPSRVAQQVKHDASKFKQRENLLSKGVSEEKVFADDNVHLDFLRRGARDNIPINQNVEETKPLPRDHIKAPLPDFDVLSTEEAPESKVDWQKSNKKYPKKLSKAQMSQREKDIIAQQKVIDSGLEEGLNQTHNLGQAPDYLVSMKKKKAKQNATEAQKTRDNQIVMVPMPEVDRLSQLKAYQTQRDEKLAKLFRLPLTKSTHSVETLRSTLEKEIRELGGKIDEMNKTPVYVTLFRGEYEKRLGELGLDVVEVDEENIPKSNRVSKRKHK